MNGRSPLHRAAGGDDIAFLAVLALAFLRNGSKAGLQPRPAQHDYLAAKLGTIPVGADEWNARFSEGAAAVTMLLLELGADPAATDGSGSTALHAACAAGGLEVVEILSVAAGSRQRDADGRTALEVAVASKQLGVVEVLVRVAHNTALGVASRRSEDDDEKEEDDDDDEESGPTAAAASVAAKGAMPFGVGGWELLHCACRLGLSGAVRLAAAAPGAARRLEALAQVSETVPFYRASTAFTAS